MIAPRLVRPLLIGLCVLSLDANAADTSLYDSLLNSILKPWVSENLPNFDYVGEEPYCDRSLSWRFVNRDDPRLRRTFPLDIEMDFCSKADTAIRYLHANDWSIKEVPNAERWIKVGDESYVFDIRLTTARKNDSSIGGWIYCRVGSCLFFIRSYSVALEAMTNLAEKIAAAVPQLPDPALTLREAGEKRFLEAIKASKEQEQEFKRTPKTSVPFPLGDGSKMDNVYTYGRLKPTALRAEVMRLAGSSDDSHRQRAADIMAFYPAFLDARTISDALIPLLNTNSISVTVSALDAAGEIALLGYTGDAEPASILSPIEPSILRSLSSSARKLRSHSNPYISKQGKRVYRAIRFRLDHPATKDMPLRL